MHVTLLRPPAVVHPLAFSGNTGSPPLGLAILVAVLKEQGHEVTVIDALGEALDQYTRLEGGKYYVNGLTTEQILTRIPDKTDFIGVSCMFSNEWIYHRRVVDAVAERYTNVPLVVGGEHASAIPEYILNCCPGVDACAVGEGEGTMLDLVHATRDGIAFDTIAGLVLRGEGGTFVRTPKRSRQRALDDLPWPAWEDVPLHNYFRFGVGHGVATGRNMPMLASRGCPYECTFCSNPQMWGRLWNVRAPENVVAEMKYYKEKYQVDSFSFFDLTAIVRKSWTIEFAKRLIEADLKVRWILPTGTRSEALDQEVVHLLKKSGCNHLQFAPESGSEETLKLIKKKVKLDKMLVSMRACAKEGVTAKANIVMGFPGEQPREMWKTYVFILKMAWAGLHDVACFPFCPYPGSELHEKLHAEGKLAPEGPEFDRMLLESANNDFASVRSWNEHISDKRLKYMLLSGMLLFYSAQFTLRPWRIAGNLYRVLSGNPVTVSERVLFNAIKRMKRVLRPASAPKTLPAPGKQQVES